MTDTIKRKIWDLVWPQIEALDRAGDIAERNLLEAEVENLILEIESEEDDIRESAISNSYDIGWDNGFDASQEEIADLTETMNDVIDSLQDMISKLKERQK